MQLDVEQGGSIGVSHLNKQIRGRIEGQSRNLRIKHSLVSSTKGWSTQLRNVRSSPLPSLPQDAG